jgi:hypothetical protein
MTEPRTIAGQAALSAMRPWMKRALGPTIVAIENEAAAPYLAALREADGLLAELIAADGSAADATQDLVKRAEAAHKLAAPLLAENQAGEVRRGARP